MAKPKSDDKREAIMVAATRLIATQGLSAPTAVIAREAGVANGSLFNVFSTKAELLNQLYCELKTEMSVAALDGLPAESDLRQQVFHTWSHGLRWIAAYPDKRRTLVHLSVSDDITQESREIGHRTMAVVARLLDRSRENGPMHDASLGFVLSLMNAIGETTADFMIRDPTHADQYCLKAFEALWRMIA